MRWRKSITKEEWVKWNLKNSQTCAHIGRQLPLPEVKREIVCEIMISVNTHSRRNKSLFGKWMWRLELGFILSRCPNSQKMKKKSIPWIRAGCGIWATLNKSCGSFWCQPVKSECEVRLMGWRLISNDKTKRVCPFEKWKCWRTTIKLVIPNILSCVGEIRRERRFMVSA